MLPRPRNWLLRLLDSVGLTIPPDEPDDREWGLRSFSDRWQKARAKLAQEKYDRGRNPIGIDSLRPIDTTGDQT